MTFKKFLLAQIILLPILAYVLWQGLYYSDPLYLHHKNPFRMESQLTLTQNVKRVFSESHHGIRNIVKEAWGNLSSVQNSDFPTVEINLAPRVLKSALLKSSKSKGQLGTFKIDGKIYHAKFTQRKFSGTNSLHKNKSWDIEIIDEDFILPFKSFELNTINFQFLPLTLVNSELLRGIGLPSIYQRPVAVKLNDKIMGLSIIEEKLSHRVNTLYAKPGVLYRYDWAESTGQLFAQKLIHSWGELLTPSYTSFYHNEKFIKNVMGRFTKNLFSMPINAAIKEFIQSVNLDQLITMMAYDAIRGRMDASSEAVMRLFLDTEQGKINFIPWEGHIWQHADSLLLSKNFFYEFIRFHPLLNNRFQKKVWKLLNGPLSLKNRLATINKWYRTFSSAYSSMPYSYSDYIGDNIFLMYSTVVTPQSFDQSYKNLIALTKKRDQFLYHHLDKLNSNFNVTKIKNGLYRLDIITTSEVPFSILKDLERDFYIWRDSNLNNRYDPDKDQPVTHFINETFQAVLKSRNESLVPYLGKNYFNLQSQTLKTQYSFWLKSKNDKFDIGDQLKVKNLITGKAKYIRKAHLDSKYHQEELSRHHLYQQLHPWKFKQDILDITPTKNIVWDDKVEINKNIVIYDNVHIRPGTDIVLKDGSSLIFRGKVTALGSKSNPIVFKHLSTFKQGVITFNGEKTQGSICTHCHFIGGNRGQYKLSYFPAALNISHTSNLSLKNCELTSATADHLVWISNSRNILIEDTLTLISAPSPKSLITVLRSDLVLNKLSSHEFRGESTLHAIHGQIRINDSLLENHFNTAISLNDESELLMNNSAIKNGKIGIYTQGKNYVEIKKLKTSNIKEHLRIIENGPKNSPYLKVDDSIRLPRVLRFTKVEKL